MPNKKIDELVQIVSISSSDQMFISDVSEASGDKAKKITINQLDARYDPSVDIGLTPLGEMFQALNAIETEIDTLNQWEDILNFSVGETSFINFGSNSFTVLTSGKYLVLASISILKSGASKNFEFSISINGMIQTKITKGRAVTSSIGNIGLVGILSLEIDDVVRVKTRNTSDTDNIVIQDCNFNIHGI